MTPSGVAAGQEGVVVCGSELAGQRGAVVMRLVQSARQKGHDPWAYLKDVLSRLPTHPNSRIEALLRIAGKARGEQRLGFAAVHPHCPGLPGLNSWANGFNLGPLATDGTGSACLG